MLNWPITSKKSGRPRKEGKIQEIENLRVRVWHKACVDEAGVRSPEALAAEFFGVRGVSQRSWERYARGDVSPSVSRKGNPGIVEKIGTLYPRTSWVFLHPLWNALNPDEITDVGQTNELLYELDEDVWRQFVFLNDDDVLVRDWASVEHPTWRFPSFTGLTIDCLAAYLLLLREARQHQRSDIEETAVSWTVAVLENLEKCPTLQNFSIEIQEMVTSYYLISFKPGRSHGQRLDGYEIPP